jgi:hypothetical protein
MNFVFAMVLLSFAFMIGAPEVVNPDDSNALIRDPKIQLLGVERLAG